MAKVELEFVDPETRAPVKLASEEELSALRAAVESGAAKRHDGAEVPSFDGAYLREDRKVAYPVDRGVPNFLVEERIELSEALA